MQKSDYRIALFLFGLLTAVYWATFGGHTYSPDEEMIYYVTEGIIERGSLTVPVKTETSSISTGARGADGKNYAITGILPSILAIPFYLIGRLVAQIFPSGFQAYWTRFFVDSFNAPVGGAISGLFYLTGRQFGYRPSTSLFLSLSLGLSTFIHIYARTFFSEPLVTLWILLGIYSAFSYRNSLSVKWITILGLALGLAVATKPQAAIAGIAFVIYLLCASLKDYSGWKDRINWLIKTALFGILGAIFPITLVLLYNYVRFRNPFETGYTAILPMSYFQGAGLEAIYGFLFSSGKSFFLYAPPAIMGLLGTKSLFRSRPLETILLWSINLVHLLFYSFFFVVWWGGGCWGPRYLTYIIPSMLLPAGAFLESNEVRRAFRFALSASLFIIGLIVQAGAILVNFNTYYNLDFGPYHSLYSVGWDSILFNPKYSPVIGHWKYWIERYRAWRLYNQALAKYADESYTFRGAFYGTEVESLNPYGGWTGGPVVIATYVVPKMSFEVQIIYFRPEREGVPQDGPIMWLNDELISGKIINIGGGRYEIGATFSKDGIKKLPIIMKIEAPLWSPAELGLSGDARRLGIFIESISVKVDGKNLKYEPNMPLFDTLPISIHREWDGYSSWWFWRADLPHLVDTWWWYVNVVGLLPQQVRAVQLVGAMTILSIATVSSCGLGKEMLKFYKNLGGAI